MSDEVDPGAGPTEGVDREEEAVDTTEKQEAPSSGAKPLPRNMYDRAVDAYRSVGKTTPAKLAKWVYQPLGGYSTLPAGRKRQKKFRRLLLVGAALSIFAAPFMAGVIGISASGFLAFTMGVLAIEAAHRSYVGVKFGVRHLAKEVPTLLSKRERTKNERLKDMDGPDAQVNEPTVSSAEPEVTTPASSAPEPTRSAPAAPTAPSGPATGLPLAPSRVPQFAEMTYTTPRAQAFGDTLATMQTALREGSPSLRTPADFQKMAADVLGANRGVGTAEENNLRRVLQTINGAPTVEAVRMTMTVAANTAGLSVAARYRAERGIPDRAPIPVAVPQRVPAAAGAPRRGPSQAGGHEVGG